MPHTASHRQSEEAKPKEILRVMRPGVVIPPRFVSPVFAEVCPKHSKLQGARSVRDVEKPRVVAADSWIELMLVGPTLTDSSEPGRKRGESDLPDVN